MLDLLVRFRFIGIPVVLALVVGTVIMIVIGVYHVYEAALLLTGAGHGPEGVAPSLAAKIELLEAIDSFVFAIVMTYFAFGAYFLLVASDEDAASSKLPEWLRVTSIGQLKKTILEVIVVILALLCLQRVAGAEALEWEILVYPAIIIGLAIALKFIPFNH